MAKIIFIHPEEQNFIRTADLLVGERTPRLGLRFRRRSNRVQLYGFATRGVTPNCNYSRFVWSRILWLRPTPMRATKSWWSLMVRCGSERNGAGPEPVFISRAIRFTGSGLDQTERVL